MLPQPILNGWDLQLVPSWWTWTRTMSITLGLVHPHYYHSHSSTQHFFSTPTSYHSPNPSQFRFLPPSHARISPTFSRLLPPGTNFISIHSIYLLYVYIASCWFSFFVNSSLVLSFVVVVVVWQDLYLGEYESYDADVVDDSWMDIISSQASSLLRLDLSASDLTDSGISYLRDYKNIISLNLNHCDRISDHGLSSVGGLSNLTSLSFGRNGAISAQGMSAFSGLVNLVKLDLERCPGIHGGLVHLLLISMRIWEKLCERKSKMP